MKDIPERRIWSDGAGHTSFRWRPQASDSELWEATYRDSDGMPLQWVVYDDGVLQRYYDVMEILYADSGASAVDTADLPLPSPPLTIKKTR